MPTKPDKQDNFKVNIEFVENFLIKNNVKYEQRDYGTTEVLFKYEGFNVWKVCSITIHDEPQDINQKVRTIKNNIAH